MRYAFILTIIALLELFSMGAALSLQWWLQPWIGSTTTSVAVWIGVFLITHVLLLLSITKLLANSYRWMSGWMLVMHFIMLTAVATGVIYGGFWLLIPLLDSTIDHSEMIAIGLRTFALLFFIALFVYSLYSAYIPVVRELSITIHKPLKNPLRIAVASDLHLGRLFGNKAIERLRIMLSKHQADILLMPGDIMDDNTQAFNTYNMKDSLAKLVASLPYGVYATLGNHDLYGHEQPISDSLRAAGVQLLNDEVTHLNHQGEVVWLMGRFDNHKHQRVATSELLAQVTSAEPVILLDHRPSAILEHSQLPIDLQVSGHTHNGQIFPVNFIVNAINRLGYGYEAIGEGHFVVSSGYGFWGIPFRLGSRSEIWIINLIGTNIGTQI
ncbi:metallophosphoesterase [Psychrobacter glacincola]|uniref:Metallophosphoesterase n=1 Tax=Psychrobacter glacincola TaxID=56810 RepID=A0ABW1W6D7_9GAMM|nr:metallophosphoesterase [Psychrobacter glacincola]